MTHEDCNDDEPENPFANYNEQKNVKKEEEEAKVDK